MHMHNYELSKTANSERNQAILNAIKYCIPLKHSRRYGNEFLSLFIECGFRKINKSKRHHVLFMNASQKILEIERKANIWISKNYQGVGIPRTTDVYIKDSIDLLSTNIKEVLYIRTLSLEGKETPYFTEYLPYEREKACIDIMRTIALDRNLVPSDNLMITYEREGFVIYNPDYPSTKVYFKTRAYTTPQEFIEYTLSRLYDKGSVSICNQWNTQYSQYKALKIIFPE